MGFLLSKESSEKATSVVSKGAIKALGQVKIVMAKICRFSIFHQANNAS